MRGTHIGSQVNLNDDLLQCYKEQGYILFENLFSEQEMDTLSAIIDGLDKESERALQKKGEDFISKSGKINFTSGLNYRNAEIQRFIADPRFVDITTSILGPDIRLYWDQSVYKRPKSDKDFPWHQDNGYVPTDPVHYVTCWLALNDATIESGCIWIQPGTHKKGLVPHVKTDIGWVCYDGDNPGIPIELKKGSMAVFHSLLFHRSSPNLTDSQTRKGYVIQYSVEDSKNPETGQIFRNGPLIARDGKSAYTDFVPASLE